MLHARAAYRSGCEAAAAALVEDGPCCCWTGGCGFAVASLPTRQCQQRHQLLHLQQHCGQHLMEHDQAQVLVACYLMILLL
jgi:hypothetical protein